LVPEYWRGLIVASRRRKSSAALAAVCRRRYDLHARRPLGRGRPVKLGLAGQQTAASCPALHVDLAAGLQHEFVPQAPAILELVDLSRVCVRSLRRHI